MLKVAIIITAISIALLLIYGADVAAGGGTEQGFLPFDHKIRGMILGITSSVLPIIGYFISKKEPSKILGIMIIISGLLIVMGSVTFLGIQSIMEKENGRIGDINFEQINRYIAKATLNNKEVKMYIFDNQDIEELKVINNKILASIKQNEGCLI